MKRLLIYIIALGSLSTATVLAQNEQSRHNFEVAKQLDIFNTLYRALDLNYVDTLEASKRMGETIRYMLGNVDPYTEYYPAEDTENLKTLSTGKYAGIGSPIVYRRDLDCAVFTDPYMDMPAYRHGVRSGDRLISIDGQCVSGEKPSDTQDYLSSITDRLRGEPGTTVVVELERPCGPIDPAVVTADTVQHLTLSIVRQQIRRPNVILAKMLDETAGYIYLTGYTEGAADEVRTAVLALKSQGMKRLVLDLRGNGGGLLNEAVKLVGHFVKRGSEVVSMRGRGERATETYRTQQEPVDRKMPIVVLTDYGTASAAEITSGALQDMDRAVVVGHRTYGKGLVQQSISLPYNGALKFTAAKYYIPSGRCIQALDYAHRGDDGQPKHLPDSLCKDFRTAGGRLVRDGGGITPDVTVKIDTLPSLIGYLRLSPQLSDWAVLYTNSHKAIAGVTEFSLSADEMECFKHFLQQRGFKYDNQSKKKLNELRSWARMEGYDAESSALFDSLEHKLAHDLDHDFQRWNKEIREVVQSEILANYYGDKGVTEYSLMDDPVLREALRILQDEERYRNLLR